MISRIVPIILFLISIGLFVGYINPVYTSKIIPLQDEIKKYNNTALWYFPEMLLVYIPVFWLPVLIVIFVFIL